MNYQISGTRNGIEWPTPGGEINLPEREAVKLLNQRMAVAVEDAPKVEKATAPKTEEKREDPKKVPARRGPGRPRKTTTQTKK